MDDLGQSERGFRLEKALPSFFALIPQTATCVHDRHSRAGMSIPDAGEIAPTCAKTGSARVR